MVQIGDYVQTTLSNGTTIAIEMTTIEQCACANGLILEGHFEPSNKD